MAQYLLGVDNGGTMAKAGLFTPDGKEVAVASRKSEMLETRPGWAEFDMCKVWRNTAASIKDVLAKSSIDPGEIRAVACTGHGNGLYLVDENAQPVWNAIGSADSRARGYIDTWLEDGTASRMRPKTMQEVWPAQPNALLRWFLENEPDVMKRARWVLMCKDFVRAQLTGEVYMELSDMSATSLMNVGTGAYEDEILKAWGLEAVKEKLPPVKRSMDVCGTVTAGAASETGLSEGTPVAGGMFDIDACGLATAVTDENSICMVAGTWGNNQYISKTPVKDGIFMTSCYAIPGYYYMLEGSPTSAGNLEWLVTEFFDAEKERAAEDGKSVYDVCNELVASVRPEESGIVFLPFLYGCNVNMDGKACLFGMDGWQKRAHVVRAVYEGIVFSHKWHMDRLLKHRGMPDAIRLAGGAARSSEWVRIFADVFQVPVEIPEGTELGALGASICAAVAAGIYRSCEDACETMVTIRTKQDPDPDMKALYDKKYGRYKKLLDVLDPVWKDFTWER